VSLPSASGPGHERRRAEASLNVALVKLSALGDVVHALPVASAISERWPAARLTWIVERRHAPVLRDHPALGAVVEVDTRGWRRARRPREVARVVREVTTVFRRLRASRFDVAIDLQGLAKSGFLAAATRAPLRIGFAPGWRPETRVNALFTNRRVVPPPTARHVVDQYLSLLLPLGATGPMEARFHLPADAEAGARMDTFFAAAGLKPRDRVVVLNPGAGRPEKRWPPRRFGEVARYLADEDIGHVVVVWGPGEEAIALAIAGGRKGALMAPATDLHALIALLRRASVVVSADSGPLHVAAALGVPCVGLFGPTSATRNGPYGCSHRCLEGSDGAVAAIEPAAVVRAVRELVQ
jgi:lipopolysaccharide heptosyltransferase I